MNPVVPPSDTNLPPAPSSCEKADYVTALLFVGIVIFAGAMVAVDKFMPADGQIFQVFAGLVTAFSGGFFTRIKSSPTPAQPQDKVKEGN